MESNSKLFKGQIPSEKHLRMTSKRSVKFNSSVQPAAPDGCECGPTQNRKFT